MVVKSKLSIIVPCYNVEKYLGCCLNSLLNQTFKDFEIVAINDGSCDNTLKILEEYSKKDNRIKIISQENKGLSGARNTGIDAAIGDYIAFLDSDDWVSPNFYQKLYEAITKNDCDIAAATIIRKREHSEKYRVFYNEERIYSTLEDKLHACLIPKCCYVWNKLYKANLVKNNKFCEGVYFEDILWTPNILKISNKLVTVPDVTHYYRVNQNSIVKKNSPKKQSDSYKAKKYIIKFFDENNIKLNKKQRTIVKEIRYLCSIPILKIKELDDTEIFYLFGLIPFLKRQSKNKERTFYNFFGIKLTIRKNKLSKKELLKINQNYENEEKNLKYPLVLNKYETLKELINSDKSISRYGDGEFNLTWGESLPFQRHSEKLSERLKEILISDNENCLIAIPDIFKSLKVYSLDAQNFWRKFVVNSREKIYQIIDFKKQYYDTEVSRPYMDLADKSDVGNYFSEFKKLWQGKDIVFVEGEKSRLGYKNDLFKGAKSIKRILCPAKNAYSRYDEIFNECLKQDKNSLFILALGPTATVLAYDLSKKGLRALDLGHIDIEYEWFIMKANKKMPIKNKYVNECKNGKNPDNVDDTEYKNQIIADFSLEVDNETV